LRSEKLQTEENKSVSYGGFSERWKHDDFERRRGWLRRNKARIAIVCSAAAAAAAVLYFVFK